MLSQVRAVTSMNLQNIVTRLGSSMVIVVGIAGVVAVLVGLLAMAAGFSAALTSTSRDDRVLILRDGSNSEMSSNMSQEEVNVVSRLEGVRAVSPELYAVVDVPKIGNNSPANLVLRGVTQVAFDVRPEVRVVAGRRMEPGKAELLAGVKAADQFRGLQVGEQIAFRGGTEWTVVGHFEADGAVFEGEVWGDLPMTQSAMGRGGTFTAARATLDDPSSFAAVAAEVSGDPRLDLAVLEEAAFYESQSASRTEIINAFGIGVAVIMAIGAVFAALNTMYSAVSVRTVEIATLRALGFGSLPVVVSVMIESLVLALLGGFLGGLLVYVLFDGYTASTLNSASFSQVAFDFAVTPELLTLGITWAVTLGAIGGLFPAIRAARLPITTALRGE